MQTLTNEVSSFPPKKRVYYVRRSPMAEFTLPDRIPKSGAGKTHKAPAGAKRVREFKIYRWNPDDGQNPRTDTYEIDLDACGPMVLDALIKIKNEVDPTLTFRRSCREGICGSCAMNIDGTNTLACLKPIDEVKGAVRIYPLPHMPVVKDLVPDLSQAYAQLRSDRAVAAGRHARRRRTASGCKAVRSARSSTGCGSASCASAAPPPARATGGTATAISARRCCCRPIAGSPISRDERTGERLDALEDPFKLYRCHTIMNCTQTCPKGLNPAKAIGAIKQLIVERQV